MKNLEKNREIKREIEKLRIKKRRVDKVGYTRRCPFCPT